MVLENFDKLDWYYTWRSMDISSDLYQMWVSKQVTGDADVIARVVPFDGKLTVFDARWFGGDVVILPECIKEVGGVVGGKELDSEVIYSKGEGGSQGCVGPKTRVWDPGV